jgi:D-lyxose ketol-isomerase
MQELEKGLELSVGPELRAEVLAKFQAQIAKWQIAMPRVEPLVLDFGLGAFEEVGLVECWICNEVTAGYCGKYLFVFDGQTCPMHRHKKKVETFFIVRGTVNMQCGGQSSTMGEGETLLIEPWTPHAFTGKGPALLLEMSTPCLIDDNYFENPAIPIGGNYGGGAL